MVRVMPNTPALVDEGMAAISRGSHCDEEHLVEAESLMASTGKVIRVPERQQDAVTAISGRAGVHLLRRRVDDRGRRTWACRARRPPSVVQTVVGSAKLIRETGEHPTVLRERVTSPAGTTAAAIRELETTRSGPPSSPRSRRPATSRALAEGL